MNLSESAIFCLLAALIIWSLGLDRRHDLAPAPAPVIDVLQPERAEARWRVGWTFASACPALVLALIFHLLPLRDVIATMRRRSRCATGSHAGHLSRRAYRVRDGNGSCWPQRRGISRRCLRAHFAGLVANLSLPGVAGGDVVRAALLFPRFLRQGRLALGSIADRLIDTIGLLLIAAVGLLFAIGSSSQPPRCWPGSRWCWWRSSAAVHSRLKFHPLAALLPVGGKPESHRRSLGASVVVLARERSDRLLLCLVLSHRRAVRLHRATIGLARSRRRRGAGGCMVLRVAAVEADRDPADQHRRAGRARGESRGISRALRRPRRRGRRNRPDVADDSDCPAACWADSCCFSVTRVLRVPDAADPVNGDANDPCAERCSINVVGCPVRRLTPDHCRPRCGTGRLGAALRLARDGRARARRLEARDRVGGNAGSFELGRRALRLRQSPAAPGRRAARDGGHPGGLGDDLLWRPRHGRIRLQGKWIHFPLKPGDLLRHLPLSFQVSPRARHGEQAAATCAAAAERTFATVLERGLGHTMSHSFYFPYARKIWGVEPDAARRDDGRAAHCQQLDPEDPAQGGAADSGAEAGQCRRILLSAPGYGQISAGPANARRAPRRRIRARRPRRAIRARRWPRTRGAVRSRLGGRSRSTSRCRVVDAADQPPRPPHVVRRHQRTSSPPRTGCAFAA